MRVETDKERTPQKVVIAVMVVTKDRIGTLGNHGAIGVVAVRGRR